MTLPDQAAELPPRPLYRYTGKAAPSDPEGYYHTRWDRATRVSVVAATSREAYLLARDALGASTRGWPWTVDFEQIEALAPGVTVEQLADMINRIENNDPAVGVIPIEDQAPEVRDSLLERAGAILVMAAQRRLAGGGL